MVRPRLRVLLPVSSPSLRPESLTTIRRFVDRMAADIVVAHVEDRRRGTASAHRAIEGVVREALGPRAGHFVVVEDHAEAAAAIARLADGLDADLVMCPPDGRPRGVFTRWVRPSFRAELLRRSPVPLWSAGAWADADSVATRPVGSIAWLVDFARHPAAQAAFVTDLAIRFDARLHLVDVVPPIDEGTAAMLFGQPRPLTPETSADALRAVLSGPCVAHISTEGTRWHEVRRLVVERRIDLLVVDRSEALQRAFRHMFPRALDRLPCPVLCLPGHPAHARRPGRARRDGRTSIAPGLLAQTG